MDFDDADLIPIEPDEVPDEDAPVEPENIEGLPLKAALRRLVEISQEYDEKRVAFEAAKRDKKALELAVWLRMEEEGDTSLTKDLGPPYGSYQFVPNETVRGRVLDPELFHEYLEERQMVDETETVDFRKRRLNELANDIRESGEKLPPGFDFTSTRYITKTKKRPKKRK